MRVLHIASWYPNPVNAQLGNFIRRHVQAVVESVECRVLHVWPGSDSNQWGVSIDDNTGLVEDVLRVPDLPPRQFRMKRAYRGAISTMVEEGPWSICVWR